MGAGARWRAPVSAVGGLESTLGSTRPADVDRLTAYVNRAPAPIYVWKASGAGFRLVDLNEAARELSGGPLEQLLEGTPTQEWRDPAHVLPDLRRALQGGQRVEREFRHRVAASGELRHIAVSYVCVPPDLVLAQVEDRTRLNAAEERVRTSERRYRALVAAANQGVWLVDPAGRTIFANAKVGRMLGHPVAEILGGSIGDFVDERDRPRVAAAVECPRDTPEAFEARLRHGDRRELLCLMSVSPVVNGGRGSTLCVLADMTVLQHERERRLASERGFRTILETANEGVWTVDPDGRTTLVNQKLAELLGVSAEEMLGRPLGDFANDRTAADVLDAALAGGGGPSRAEVRLRRADGGPVDVIMSLSALREEQGEPAGALAMVADVTLLKREEQELRESQQRFAQVFEEAPVGIVFIGAGRLNRGSILGANPAFRELLGYSEGELRERRVRSLTHPDDLERELPLARDLLEGARSTYEIDKRFVRADGSHVWTRFRQAVLRDERGSPLYGIGVAVDISAEKEAARATDDAAGLARAVLQSTPDAVLELCADGSVANLNRAAVRTFGCDASDVAGTHFADAIVPPRSRTAVRDVFADLLREAAGQPSWQRLEVTACRSDASEFAAELTIARVEGSDPARFTCYVRNLAVHERSDAARREAEERFTQMFRDSLAGVALVSLEDRLIEVNPALCRLAGRRAAELIGQSAAEVFCDRGGASAAPWHGKAGRPQPIRATRQVVRPDGRAVPLEIAASVVRDVAGAPAYWIVQCLSHGLHRPDEGELPCGEPLSYRERQVLGLLAHGHDGPAIAERLGIAPETVRSYAQTAREKLGAETRTQAVVLALARGEITP